MSFAKLLEEIKRNDSFLITAHVNLEPDALGSELAFLHLLKELGKKAFIINESSIPFDCKFIPGVDQARQITKKRPKPFDCMVFLDCSDKSRTGKVANLLTNKTRTINIDHHISNTYFADVNMVDAKASSACEMVYRIFRRLNVNISLDAAIALYSGIIADTGSFRFNNTGAETHRVAAELIELGVGVARVYNDLYQTNSPGDIKLLGNVLSNMESDSSGKVVWAEVSYGILDDLPEIDLGELVLGMLRSVKGIEVAIVFKEIKGEKNQVRVNFRSQSYFDCNKLAGEFSGGGHKNASGATITGNLKDIKSKIIKRAREMLNG
jgi:bifunctional oligoribonuclease and PAP phosphatase NrnA